MVVHEVQQIWNRMKDLNERKNEAYYMTHDGKATVNKWNVYTVSVYIIVQEETVHKC